MIAVQSNLIGIVAASRQKTAPVAPTVHLRTLGAGLDELGEAFWRKTAADDNRLVGE